jgi:Acetyltransferase (GNAT) domain
MSHHFPRVLQDEGRTLHDIQTAFSHTLLGTMPTLAPNHLRTQLDLVLCHEQSIEKIDHATWDALFADAGTHDWEGMRFLEEVLRNNERFEENFDFHYYFVRDANKRIVLATFFTCGLYKDDFLAHETVSRRIEQRRAADPYYLVSKTFAMGSLLTEGQHLFLDRHHPQWRDALGMLLDEVAREQLRADAEALLLRDFHGDDSELRDILLDKGFIKLTLPPSNIAQITWNTREEFLAALSAKSRRNVRREILKYEPPFEVEVKNKISDEEADAYYTLYREVHRRNIGLNMFPYPPKITRAMSAHPRWEFVILRLTPEHDPRPVRHPVAVTWCYRSPRHYNPVVMGMDYDFVLSHGVYRQNLYQCLLRARQLGVSDVRLGLTAEIEKRKLGCRQVPYVAYLQARDNFNLEVIETMPIAGRSRTVN